MSSFYEVIEAGSALSLDEQESVVEIMQKRIIEEKRNRIILEVRDAEQEYESGKLQASDLDDFLKEL